MYVRNTPNPYFGNEGIYKSATNKYVLTLVEAPISPKFVSSPFLTDSIRTGEYQSCEECSTVLL